VAIDTDAEVAAAINDVFAAFAQTGSLLAEKVAHTAATLLQQALTTTPWFFVQRRTACPLLKMVLI
jgi:hypothetical protein